MKALEKIIDFILPPRCVVSGEIVDLQGMISPKVWADLQFIATPLCDKCGAPFSFQMDDDSDNIAAEGTHCGACVQKPPSYNRARAALVYDDASRNLILPFKHGDKTHYAVSFVPWLKQAGHALIDNADILVPVPLHPLRLLQRRYNQAAIMTKYLAQACNKDFCLEAITRTRSTPTQAYLRGKERAKNVKRAFAVLPPSLDRVADKKILIIDDVYTTGSTVNECAKALYKAGAGNVDVLALAKVVKK